MQMANAKIPSLMIGCAKKIIVFPVSFEHQTPICFVEMLVGKWKEVFRCREEVVEYSEYEVLVIFEYKKLCR